MQSQGIFVGLAKLGGVRVFLIIIVAYYIFIYIVAYPSFLLYQGYLDPEYIMTRQLTVKSDVYSFGVVMLELVSGRLPIPCDNSCIIREIKDTMNETGYIYNLVDPVIRSGNLIGMEEFVKLALKCVEDTGNKRPSMGEVVKEIESIIHAGKVILKDVLSSYQRTREGSTNYSHTSMSGPFPR